MTDFERLSLLALAEIIEVLQEIRNPQRATSLGLRRGRVMDDIREAVVDDLEDTATRTSRALEKERL
jgi:hypothetical protein